MGSCQGRTRIIIDDIDIYNRNLIRKEDDLREETFSELEVAAKECVMAVFTADTKLSKSCKRAHKDSELLRAIQICTVQLSHGGLFQRRFAAAP